MNRPLRKVAVACLVLFAALMLNTNYLQVVRASALRKDPHNTRLLVDSYRRERGPIVVGGQAVAESVATSDRLKYLRRYPGGAEYAPVTGYYSLSVGETGVERAQDDVLSGSDERLFVRRLSDLVTGREPQGGTVVLTLDRAAQDAASRALGSRRGAVVALDPKTGAVLAMVTSPSYDPSQLASHDPAQILKNFSALKQTDGDPLLNRATQSTYPPGSLFKVVTAAAALSSGKYTPDSQLTSPTQLKLPLTRNLFLKNFGGEQCGNGQTDSMADALRISCNTAFASLGLALGEDTLRSQAKAFGVGSTVSDFPVAVSSSHFPESLDKPQTAFAAIGQFDVRITPLQAAMIISAVANGGTEMKPYLVNEIQAPDLSVLSRTSPAEMGRPVSKDVAQALTGMMLGVVEGGTGTAAQIPGVKVAGKTGTAQHAEGKAPHAWFGGFAPADDPKVAVAVVVEDGGNAGNDATGGTVAAPIAKAVIEAVLNGKPGGQ